MTALIHSRIRITFAALFAACLLLGVATSRATAQTPTIIYVNAAAAPGGNGTSWATAFNDLQAALAAGRPVASPSTPVEIWVAHGVYRPGPPGNRDVSFELFGSLTLLGGFVGTETSRDQRLLESRDSVLTGDLLGNDAPGFDGASRVDNSYTVVRFPTGNHAPIALDGFTVRGAFSHDLPANPITMSGIDAAGSSGPKRVQRCLITNNAGRWAGGGMASNGPCTVLDCDFIDNRASFGGAMIIGSLPGQGIVNRCRFLGNRAVNRGAGALGGAIWVGSHMRIINSEFSGNVSDGDGGALSIHTEDADVAVVLYCTFASNAAPNGSAISGYIFAVQASIVWGNTRAIVYGNLYNCTVPTGSVTGPNQQVNAMQYSDPRFVSPLGNDGVAGTADDDLSLGSDSPAIDAGTFSLAAVYGSLDCRGRLRKWDGDGNGAANIDIGAHERLSPSFASGRAYVDAAKPAGGDGTSWATAFSGTQPLQRALALAADNPGAITEIWVARGTYTPAPPGGSRSASFNLQSNLAIYGGFVGTETDLSQRNTIAYPTVLSGDLNGDDVGDLNRAENSYHVLRANGVAATAVLDGFTVRAGNASGSGVDGNGGGIRIDGGAPTISNCEFVSNLEQGLFNSGGSPVVRNCVFRSNRSTTDGGGVVEISGAAGRYVGCRFTENTARYGGGALISAGGAPCSTAFVDCRFDLNAAEVGAGFCVFSPGHVISFVNCRFLSNRATSVPALYLEQAALTAVGCEFSANLATSDGASAVLIGTYGSGTFTNCTFAGNVQVANIDGKVWGALSIGNNLFPVSATVRNCLFWNNSNVLFGNGQEAQLAVRAGGGSLSINYSTVQNWSGSLGGTNNNGLNPSFLRLSSAGTDGVWGTADDDFGDPRLSIGSPAADSGDSGALPPDSFDIDSDKNTTEALPLDLAGFPRFVDDPAAANTGTGAPPVDRGAYERPFDCPTCPGPRDWIAIGGGSYSQPGNWTPSTPNSTHDTTYKQALTYSVNLPAASSLANRSAAVERGSPTWSVPASTTLSLTATSTQALTIASEPFRSAALTITGGGLVRPNSASIANDPDAVGSLTLTGANTRLSITNGDLSVGFLGDGSFSVLSGAKATTRTATLGSQPGAVGTALVSGAGSTWTVPFGLLVAGGSATVSNGGFITTTVGTILLQDGLLTGNSSVNGPVYNFGTISPGLSPGTLTINGDYTQIGQIEDFGSSAGQLLMEIPASGSGVSDQLMINGLADLSGGLVVRADTGGDVTVPDAGTDFTLLRARDGFNLGSRFDVAYLPRAADNAAGPQFFRVSYQPCAACGASAEIVRMLSAPITTQIGITDPQQETSASGTPTAAASGDLNGDGLDDLVLTVNEAAGGQVVILLNRGVDIASGWLGFAAPVAYPVGLDPVDIALGDLNGDGLPDVAIANRASDSVSVFRNQSFGAVADLSLEATLTGGIANPTGVAIVTLDGSDRPSIVVTSSDPTAPSILAFQLDTSGPRGLERRWPVPSVPLVIPIRPNSLPWRPRPLDIDGDNRSDLAVISQEGQVVSLYQNLSAAGGPMNLSTPYAAATGGRPVDVQVLNLDSRADGTLRPSLVTANAGDGTISVITNQVQSSANLLDPSFEPLAPAVTLAAGTMPRSVAGADVDADGDDDIAVLTTVTSGSQVRIFRNDFRVDGQRVNDQPTLVADRDVPEAPTTGNALFVVGAQLIQPGRVDLITILPPGGLLRGGEAEPNIRPRLISTPGACASDYNRDGIANLDDLSEMITDFYTVPAIPGGAQAAAPTYAGMPIGWGQPCPLAGDAAAPYSADAYRTQGYRIAYSADGSNACPSDASQTFPNLDHLSDLISLYYGQVNAPICTESAGLRRSMAK